MVRRISSGRSSARRGSPRPLPVLDALDAGWGAALGDLHLSGLWSPLCSKFSINHWELLAVLYVVQGFLPSLRGRLVAVYSDNSTALAYLRKQGGTRSSTLNMVASSPLRTPFYLASPPVHSRSSECSGGFSQPPLSSPVLQVDLVSGGVTRSSSPVASHHRPFHDVAQSSAAGVLLADDRSAVSWHGCHAPAVGQLSGLCLSIFRPHSAGSGEGSSISGVGAYAGGSVLTSAPLVSRLSGASGGDSLLPATKEGSSQTAPFPLLPPEPPCASADCVSYLQRSARHAGFSAAVARHLTNCRRRSTRVKYQAKWAVYRAWCRRHVHSVSRPMVSKVADFLLYLRRSLSLSYSSIASYRSMLSGVFRFVLPEISSHFVLHDLLRSFCLERPLPSSRVPL